MLYDEILKPFVSEDVAGDDEEDAKEPEVPTEEEEAPKKDDSDEIEEV